MQADGEGGAATGRPSLVFLGHGAERTGPPILLGHLLDGLAATQAYDVSVVTARSGPLLARYRASGARTSSLGAASEPLGRGASALRQLGAGAVVPPLQHARRRLATRRAGPADLVYVNGATPATADLLDALAPPPSVPVLLHVHELDIGLRTNLRDDQRLALFDRAHHVIAASDAVARLLRAGHGIAAHRITTCAEFIDLAALAPRERRAARKEAGVPGDRLVVGSVGLPDWRKDPDHLLRAVHQLRRDRPDLDPWVVWIGGDPASPDGQRVADEAARLGLADRFRHLAHLDRPDHLLSAFDVFALPAREDALPLAALEGAGAGLPLVCFRTGGIADLCDAGAGVAVDYPDTAAFAAALAGLLADEQARSEVGALARDLVRDRHDLAVGVARIRAVIDRALAPEPR